MNCITKYINFDRNLISLKVFYKVLINKMIVRINKIIIFLILISIYIRNFNSLCIYEKIKKTSSFFFLVDFFIMFDEFIKFNKRKE